MRNTEFLVICQSTMIGQAAYSMNWYKASGDVKTEVYLIILRSQKPCYLTAGKLYAMSMQSFGGVIRFVNLFLISN